MSLVSPNSVRLIFFTGVLLYVDHLVSLACLVSRVYVYTTSLSDQATVAFAS